MPSSRINPWKAQPTYRILDLLQNSIIISTSQNVDSTTTKRQISLPELMIGARQQPRPPRSKTFSWPEDNSGSELCRIRFLSCCWFCLDLPHHHDPSHRRCCTTSPEQWYPAKFSGKCSLTYGCSHVGNIGSEYAKRQFFTRGFSVQNQNMVKF